MFVTAFCLLFLAASSFLPPLSAEAPLVVERVDDERPTGGPHRAPAQPANAFINLCAGSYGSVNGYLEAAIEEAVRAQKK